MIYVNYFVILIDYIKFYLIEIDDERNYKRQK